MIYRKPNKTRKGVIISEDNLKWFYQEFGDDASISWYMNLLLTKAKEVHTDTIYTPSKVAIQAAKEIMEIENEH